MDVNLPGCTVQQATGCTANQVVLFLIVLQQLCLPSHMHEHELPSILAWWLMIISHPYVCGSKRISLCMCTKVQSWEAPAGAGTPTRIPACVLVRNACPQLKPVYVSCEALMRQQTSPKLTSLPILRVTRSQPKLRLPYATSLRASFRHTYRLSDKP